MAATRPLRIYRSPATRLTILFKRNISTMISVGISAGFVTPSMTIIPGIWLTLNARAAIILPAHNATCVVVQCRRSRFRRKTHNPMTNERKRIYSPIPAVAEAIIEKGKAGWGNPSPSPAATRIRSAMTKITPIPNPNSMGQMNQSFHPASLCFI